MVDFPTLLSPINVSEGARLEVIQSIVSSCQTEASRVLDVHSDPDHNRTVITVAGPSPHLLNALLSASHSAIELIDLRIHRGAHPRMGAIDVVPFVPILGAHMTDACNTAADFAKRLWATESIPSFFYDEAARAHSKAFRTLPEIRRDAFERLAPDTGEGAGHPTAGAVCVGARGPLVAFNVNLGAGDLSIARAISSSIRQPGRVRALAFPLASRGLVQVSTNIVDPSSVTLGELYDRIAAAVDTYGVRIENSEVVGLVPSACLGGRDHTTLSLPERPRILEEALMELAP